MDPEWLRHRIYTLLNRALTVDVRPVAVGSTRILAIVVPEAIEPVRYRGRITHRVGTHCVELDATSWHLRRRDGLQVDWSAQPSSLTTAAVREVAVETARDFLAASNDPSAQELAEATTPALLRRLNAVTGDGRLTNGAALVFVGRDVACIDYIRRDVAGGDSRERVRRGGRSLVEQLAEVFAAARAHNPMTHLGEGLAIGQARQLPERALREAIVNGVAHREWGVTDPTVVEHVGGTLRVTSPGGFVGGVTADNIINHVSKSRNTALTEFARQAEDRRARGYRGRPYGR